MGRGMLYEAIAPDWSNFSSWAARAPSGYRVSSRPDVEDPIVWQDQDDNFHAIGHNLEVRQSKARTVRRATASQTCVVCWQCKCSGGVLDVAGSAVSRAPSRGT